MGNRLLSSVLIIMLALLPAPALVTEKAPSAKRGALSDSCTTNKPQHPYEYAVLVYVHNGEKPSFGPVCINTDPDNDESFPGDVTTLDTQASGNVQFTFRLEGHGEWHWATEAIWMVYESATSPGPGDWPDAKCAGSRSLTSTTDLTFNMTFNGCKNPGYYQSFEYALHFASNKDPTHQIHLLLDPQIINHPNSLRAH